ncbi:hypothetical protein LTR35_002021 [Friedmanniomyces endolithicus]|nr:hypothetical protein LTR35_002021 [Friedmanniomyces endolithicus]
MGIRRRSHSRSWKTSEPPTRRTGLGAIVATQHVLLWSSAYVSASETYLLIEGYITPDLLPSSIVLLVSLLTTPDRADEIRKGRDLSPVHRCPWRISFPSVKSEHRSDEEAQTHGALGSNVELAARCHRLACSLWDEHHIHYRETAVLYAAWRSWSCKN